MRDSRTSLVSLPRSKTVLLLFIGLVLGLVVALAVALYVIRAPVPKLTESLRLSPDSTTEQKGQPLVDPNTPLHGLPPLPVDPQTEEAEVDEAPVPDEIESLASVETPQPPELLPEAGRASEAETSSYMLQLAAYTTAEEAEQQKAHWALRGYETSVRAEATSHSVYYRLSMGPFKDLAAAKRMQAQLARAKTSSVLVKMRRE
jgi:cell division protein FtsN